MATGVCVKICQQLRSGGAEKHAATADHFGDNE
jgi:hypothetical protein